MGSVNLGLFPDGFNHKKQIGPQADQKFAIRKSFIGLVNSDILQRVQL